MLVMNFFFINFSIFKAIDHHAYRQPTGLDLHVVAVHIQSVQNDAGDSSGTNDDQ